MPYGLSKNVAGESSKMSGSNPNSKFNSPTLSSRIITFSKKPLQFNTENQNSQDNKSKDYEIDDDLNSISIVDSVSSNQSDEVLDMVPQQLLEPKQIAGTI